MALPGRFSGRPPRGGRGFLDTCDLLRRELAADGVGVRLGGGQRTGTEVVHVSDLLGSALEELQFVLGEGPAVTCFATGQAVQVPQVDAPVALGRWPGFIPEAARAGAASIVALPLWVRAGLLGTITVHRRDCRPFRLTPDAVRLADELAWEMVDLVVLADMGDERWWDGMPQLPELRPDVHVAAGMLSAKWGVGTEYALARLCATAFSEQQTVQQLAREVVHRRRTLDLDRGRPGL